MHAQRAPIPHNDPLANKGIGSSFFGGYATIHSNRDIAIMTHRMALGTAMALALTVPSIEAAKDLIVFDY